MDLLYIFLQRNDAYKILYYLYTSHVTFISRQHINEVKLWIIFMSINNVENLVSKTSNKI